MDNSSSFPTTVFDWFNFIAQDSNSNALIQFVISTKKPLDFDILCQATRSCILADPLLACRFDDSLPQPQWTSVPDQEMELCLKVSASENNDVVKSCLAKQIDARRECPVKIYYISGDSNNQIVVKVHHALCDAAGALQYVRLLAEHYSKLCEISHSKLSDNPCWKPQRVKVLRDTKAFYDYYGVNNARERFNPRLLSPMTSTWGTPIGDLSSEQSFDYQTISLDQEDFELIRKRAASIGVSLNALLMAAYHRALAETLQPKSATKEIQFSANMRRFCPPLLESSISNLSNLYSLELPVGVSFEEVSKAAQNALDKVLVPEVILQSVLACELFTASFKTMAMGYQQDWENVKQSGLCTPMMANLGKLDAVDFSFGDQKPSQMYVVSPAFTGPSFMMVASTWNSKMTFCVSYRKPSTNPDFVTKLFKEFKAALV